MEISSQETSLDLSISQSRPGTSDSSVALLSESDTIMSDSYIPQQSLATQPIAMDMSVSMETISGRSQCGSDQPETSGVTGSGPTTTSEGLPSNMTSERSGSSGITEYSVTGESQVRHGPRCESLPSGSLSSQEVMSVAPSLTGSSTHTASQVVSGSSQSLTESSYPETTSSSETASLDLSRVEARSEPSSSPGISNIDLSRVEALRLHYAEMCRMEIQNSRQMSIGSETSRIQLPGLSPAQDTGRIQVPGSSPVQDVGRIQLPNSSPSQDVGRIQLPGSSPSQDTCRIQLPDSSPAKDIGKIQMPASGSSQETCRIQLPGSSPVKDASRIQLPGSNPSLDAGRIQLPGSSHSQDPINMDTDGSLDLSKSAAALSTLQPVTSRPTTANTR